MFCCIDNVIICFDDLILQPDDGIFLKATPGFSSQLYKKINIKIRTQVTIIVPLMKNIGGQN